MADTVRFGKGSTNDYMVDISLPSHPPEEFVSLIPAQREYVNRLMEEGMLTSHSLAYDRSQLWVTMRAHSEKEVVERVAKFPLIRWMEVEIRQLMFRDTGAPSLPLVSLN
jgi:hypothetical protein